MPIKGGPENILSWKSDLIKNNPMSSPVSDSFSVPS
jgi:hypothetical protein